MRDKLGKINTTYLTQTTKAHVILTVEGNLHKAEMTMRAFGREFIASDACDDMYAAIDLMTAKLDRQVRQFKEKIVVSRRTAT